MNRIDLYHSMQQTVVQRRQADRSPQQSGDLPTELSSSAHNAPSSDNCTFSPRAQELRTLTEEAMNLPDVDINKVNSIKERLISGNYHVDPDKLATRIIDFEALLNEKVG